MEPLPSCSAGAMVTVKSGGLKMTIHCRGVVTTYKLQVLYIEVRVNISMNKTIIMAIQYFTKTNITLTIKHHKHQITTITPTK